MQVIALINNVGTKINVDVNVRNWFDKWICHKRFIWNPSNCECECNKSCNVAKYLDFEKFKCRKKLVVILVEECSENIDRNEKI